MSEFWRRLLFLFRRRRFECDPKFQDLRRLSSSFQSLAAYGRGNFDLADHPAERVRGEFVSSAYFRTLAVPAALGRTFLPQEDAVLRAGAVAVIADSLWKRRFGADPAVLGKEIRVETISVRIVGVAPPGFTGETGRAELWLPITMAPLAGKSDSALTFRAEHWHMVVGRLKRSVTRAQAASEVAAVMQRVEQTSPTPGWRRTAFGTDLVPLAESRLEPSERRAIFVLYGAVGFVLLIACGNLTNLTRARMVGRQRETAMRLALGAGRGSLLRQFLAENLLLSLAGGAAGVLLASWTSRLLIYLRPADYASLPSYFRTLDPDSLRLTVPVLAFSLALSLASGLLFGLMPALRAARGDVYTTLKQGSTGRRAGRGPGFRSVLLPAQMALAVVLLSGGVLMMRSFARLVNDPMGAEVHRVLAFEVSLPDYRYPNRQSRRAFLDRAAARLRELPAVESVALSDDVPALERDTVTDIAVANRPGSDFIGKLSSLWWFVKALCYALSDWQPAFPRRWLPRARWAACCMELTPAIP
ncbi:MAG TPA: ABC transporter permease [Bryobacteraceae bacterium]|nr:ABC transporter permease [Bryobacteraceae bacterium]